MLAGSSRYAAIKTPKEGIIIRKTTGNAGQMAGVFSTMSKLVTPAYNKKHNGTKNDKHQRGFTSFLVLIIFIFWLIISPAPCFPDDLTKDDTSLDIKTGQMIIVGFRGLTVDNQSPVVQDITKRHIGGVILFDYDVPQKSPVRNIASPKQIKALTLALQKASSIPLFIAIDQEGRRVNRLKEKYGFPTSVSAQYLGSINNINTSRKYARGIAKTLAGVGINLNFAPVVDLNTNPDNPVIGKLERSFSSDPGVVISQASTFIDAFHEYHVLSAIKHFPGHCSSTGDSHKGLTDVTNTWSPIELKPFDAIIKSGKCDMVMTAHVFNKKLDPKWPATLSYKTLTGILRKDFHYDGIIISDDMQMKAISTFYSLETAIRMAILAGVDLLVFPNNSVFEEDIATRAIAIIKRLVADDIVSRERINESYMRIRKLKERLRPFPG